MERAPRVVVAGPLAGLLGQALLLVALAATVGLSAAAWAAGLVCGFTITAVLARALSRYGAEGLRAADWVTLGRASFAVGAAALVTDSFTHRTPVALLVSIAGLALTLDSVDGWVARKTSTAAALGAWIDGEADALLLLILSVYVARSSGPWVLAIGGARYAFLVAGWPLRWLRAPLPRRDWRKPVAATQGIVLTVATAGILPLAVTQALLFGALILLAESFGRDVLWLWTRRHDLAAPAAPAAARGGALDHGRVRRSLAAALTVLSVVIVWGALVAPNQPQELTLSAFLRVPVEGLVLIAVASALPIIPRRVMAAVLGPTLAVLVVLKALDMAFFTAFARPFDLVGDAGDAGFGVETLRAALGNQQANLILYGGLALIVTLFAVITMATLRLTRVAAEHRRGSLLSVAGLAAVGLIASSFGGRLAPPGSLVSTSTVGYVVHEVRAVETDIHDQAVFAREITQDRYRNTPGSRLLTALRGKDVLLVFVESYGRVSVESSSFSPAIDAVLNRGTNQLRSAGFSARSAFVEAPAFGGISWLAHSTLQSGVWANSQRRYSQLVASSRLTLSDAFKRAGWRTINFAPADDRSWPEGSSFYHYDKLYDRRQMGYRGPAFNYAPLPDQYMFAALQRLELARPHRSLFAEVDTVSSHMPWDRIPRMVPWNRLGNGSVFNHIPIDSEPSSFWWHPDQVKAAYARSLKYSLNALTSFVRHYGKRNLVLIVVGDEQPLAIVSGRRAGHDVPISIIAHDPSVLKRIGGWGWNPGLLPSPHAPVMRMSAFRDRFLTAYGTHPSVRQASSG